MGSADSSSIQRRPYTVRTSADPSGSLPEFGVSRSFSENPTTWVDGSWVAGTLKAHRLGGQEIKALSPLVGDGQDLDITENGIWVIWIRWTVGDETPLMAAEQVDFY